MGLMDRVRSPRRSPSTAVDLLPRDDQGFNRAVGALAKTILEEPNLAKGFLAPQSGTAPGSSWSNQGTINNALIARVSQNLAASFGRAPADLEVSLASHGLSYGPPFPPGRPLDPFWGYGRPARTMDYQIGENVQVTPRWNRISYGTLKTLFNSYYAFQICVNHLINDVRSLDYQFIPPENVLEDVSDDLQTAAQFMAMPDKRQPFRAWLAEYLMDVLRYDAGTLYVRRNNIGEPIALEVVEGTTIIPLIDYFGRPPADENDQTADPEGVWEGRIVPAFVQIIQGMPFNWLRLEDILYFPVHPLPESQYGLAPMEAVLLQANTDIRFQWHFLQYFTQGSVPAGFMEAPPDLTDPIQVEQWQREWDNFVLGDQGMLRQLRWVPQGAKYTATKNAPFDSSFPLYLMRCTAAAFGVTPNDLGFTEDVNRSTGEIQVDVQFRVGTLPIVRHVEDVINLFLSEHMGLKARIAFDTGQGTAHRLATAQADDIYINNGTLGQDEVRMKLGKRISRDNPTPRFVNNNRAGPIPLAAIMALAGEIDPTTFGPAKGTNPAKVPFFSAAGVAPVIGSDDYKTAQDATANMQRGMLGLPAIPPDPPPQPTAAQKAMASEFVKSLQRDYTHTPYTQADETAWIASLFARQAEGGYPGAVAAKAYDNTGGPGVKQGAPMSLDCHRGDHERDRRPRRRPGGPRRGRGRRLRTGDLRREGEEVLRDARGLAPQLDQPGEERPASETVARGAGIRSGGHLAATQSGTLDQGRRQGLRGGPLRPPVSVHYSIALWRPCRRCQERW